MALYFLDSSAIVKRYFQEPGHEWIETLHDSTQDHGSPPGRFGREQVQSFEAIPIFEEALSTARNHRVDQENQLIQQALVQQRANEGWTSGSADVLSWLLLQLLLNGTKVLSSSVTDSEPRHKRNDLET